MIKLIKNLLKRKDKNINKFTSKEKFNLVLSEVISDAVNIYFQNNNEADFMIVHNSIKIGKFSDKDTNSFKIISINLDNKNASSFQTGIKLDNGKILKKVSYYESYKNRGKFVKFIDKWYDKLVEANKEV